MRAVRLLQGYLWHPRALKVDPVSWFPSQIELEGETVHLATDPIRPPFAFFDDGTPTESQRFYQLTALVLSSSPDEALLALAERVASWLEARLEATPEGVGWLIFGDLRAL